MLAARLQRLEQRPEVILQEQHGGHDDVRLRDVRTAALQRLGFAAPFVGRVDLQCQPGKFLGKPL